MSKKISGGNGKEFKLMTDSTGKEREVRVVRSGSFYTSQDHSAWYNTSFTRIIQGRFRDRDNNVPKNYEIIVWKGANTMTASLATEVICPQDMTPKPMYFGKMELGLRMIFSPKHDEHILVEGFSYIHDIEGRQFAGQVSPLGGVKPFNTIVETLGKLILKDNVLVDNNCKQVRSLSPEFFMNYWGRVEEIKSAKKMTSELAFQPFEVEDIKLGFQRFDQVVDLLKGQLPVSCFRKMKSDYETTFAKAVKKSDKVS